MGKDSQKTLLSQLLTRAPESLNTESNTYLTPSYAAGLVDNFAMNRREAGGASASGEVEEAKQGEQVAKAAPYLRKKREPTIAALAVSSLQGRRSTLPCPIFSRRRRIG